MAQLTIAASGVDVTVVVVGVVVVVVGCRRLSIIPIYTELLAVSKILVQDTAFSKNTGTIFNDTFVCKIAVHNRTKRHKALRLYTKILVQDSAYTKIQVLFSMTLLCAK